MSTTTPTTIPKEFFLLGLHHVSQDNSLDPKMLSYVENVDINLFKNSRHHNFKGQEIALKILTTRKFRPPMEDFFLAPAVGLRDLRAER